MKKDKEKKKKRLKRASPSPAPVEVVSAGESVQPTAPEAPLVYFLRVAGANGKSGFYGRYRMGNATAMGRSKARSPASRR